jgi:molybdenum cofactor cytidylyltransferase
MLLPVAGEPMVRRTARLAREGGCDPVIVVVGHEPHLVHRTLDGVPCRIAVSDDFRGPTSASLHAGLRALGPEVGAAVVLLGDMVHVTAPMVAALIASHRADGGPLEVSRYGDVLAPPLLFPRALWPELLAWTGEGCGKAVVRAHEAEAVLHDWPAAALRDVDTPADYEALTP